MRRLAPHSFTATAGLSLLLCLALLGSWARSHYRSESVGYGSSDGTRAWAIGTVVDAVYLERINFAPVGPGFHHNGDIPEPWNATWQRVGFGFERRAIYTAVLFPFWFIIIGTAIPPVWWVLKRRRSAAGRGFEVRPGGTGDGLSRASEAL